MYHGNQRLCQKLCNTFFAPRVTHLHLMRTLPMIKQDRSNSNQDIQIVHVWSFSTSKPVKVIAPSERTHKMHTNNLHSEGLVVHVIMCSPPSDIISQSFLRTNKSILVFSFVVFARLVAVDQTTKPNERDSVRL